MMKHLFPVICLLVLASCSKDDDSDTYQAPAERTVVVYMAGENNLTSYIQGDLDEMITGFRQVTNNENLVVFVDKASTTVKPFIAKVTKDPDHPLDTLHRYEQDFYSSAPAAMADVLNLAVTLCPATRDYGLVLWGHACGWVFADSVPNSRRAFGFDSGNNTAIGADYENGKWLNIPSMREALDWTGIKWKYIFADCCNMSSIEVAYELRNNTDYLISSPAEIPGNGAPYITVVPDLFLNTETFYQNIIDDYAAAYPNKIPLAAIKTEKVSDLAGATARILPTVSTFLESVDLSKTIYYYDYKSLKMLDMNEIIHMALAGDDANYQAWRNVFDQVVVAQKSGYKWSTVHSINFSSFTMDNYGGVNMYFPLKKYNTTNYKYNELIKKLSWYYAVGWPSVGW